MFYHLKKLLLHDEIVIQIQVIHMQLLSELISSIKRITWYICSNCAKIINLLQKSNRRIIIYLDLSCLSEITNNIKHE